MRILAIDPGLTKAHPMGWATWDGSQVRSGSFCFQERSDDHRGVRLSRLRMWLETMCEEILKPQAIAYEMPTVQHYAGAVAQIGAVALIDMAACDVGAELAYCYPAQLKKWATGSGRASKDDMRLACHERYGFDPGDDHEADALLLLAWARETLKEGK